MQLKYNYEIKQEGRQLILCKYSKIKGILMNPIVKKDMESCIEGVKREINNCISETEADTKVAEFCLL